MTQHRSGPPIKPSVIGIPDLPKVNGLDSPRIELLARIAIAGGTLTRVEAREVSAAVIAYLDARREIGTY